MLTNFSPRCLANQFDPVKGLQPILSRPLTHWGRFLRYDYAVFDFTAVREPGVYVLRYRDGQTLPFRIATDVYQKGVWQPTLETFFPVQMCHMRVVDRGRVWHGVCYLDDALQAPPNLDLSYVEGYPAGADYRLPLFRLHAHSRPQPGRLARALPVITEVEFTRRLSKAVARYAAELRGKLAQNPFGVPFEPQIWGVTWSIQNYAVQQYFLHKAYPKEFARENILRVLDYVLGCHPASSTSLVSGVGAHSLMVAYGTNVNEWSHIPGGGASTYLFTVLAADQILSEGPG